MKTETSFEAAQAHGPDVEIYRDAEDSYRVYFPGEITRADPPVDARTDIAKEIDASPALSALAGEVAALKGLTKDVLIGGMEAKRIRMMV